MSDNDRPKIDYTHRGRADDPRPRPAVNSLRPAAGSDRITGRGSGTPPAPRWITTPQPRAWPPRPPAQAWGAGSPSTSLPITAAPLQTLQDAEFAYVEGVRFPGDGDDFAALTRWDTQLRARLGHGVQRVVMTDRGRLPLGDRYNCSRFAAHPATGNVAAGAQLSHAFLGRSGALDVGVFDGRNIVDFLQFDDEAQPVGFDLLYLGWAATERFEMAEAAGQICGLSFSPDGTRLAYVEWRGQPDGAPSCPGFLTEQELATGQRTFIGAFPDFSGSCAMQYSPDGRWLLLNTGRHVRLVRIADGWSGALALGGSTASASWSPAEGASILRLVIPSSSGDEFHLCRFDLQTGRVDEHRPVVGVGELLYLTDLAVHPLDPTRALAISPHGHLEPYRAGHGARGHLQTLDMTTGTLRPALSGTIDGTGLERVHDNPSWTAAVAPPVGETVVDVRRLQDTGVLARPAPTPYLRDACSFALKRAVATIDPDLPTRRPEYVWSEFVRALQYFDRIDPALGQRVASDARPLLTPPAMRSLLTRPPSRAGAALIAMSIAAQAVENREPFDWEGRACHAAYSISDS